MSKISELSDGGALLSTDDLIVVRSGGNVRAQLSSLNGIAIGSSTPAAGSFTTGSFSGNVSFADNAKAIFGTSGDGLEIYHDSNNSYIKDQGTGDLIIEGSDNIWLMKAGGSEVFLNTADDGAVTLYHNNAAKLATTSTGIDVTGTVTADGLTSSASIQTTGSSSYFISNSSSSGDYIRLYAGSGTGKWDIYGNGANLRIGDNDSAGSVVIDTNVGIGTSSPDTLLELVGADPILTVRDSDTSSGTANATLRLAESGASDSLGAYWDIKAVGGQLQFIDNWNEGGGTGTRVVINDSGNVGIGTTPSHPLHITKEIAGYQAYFNNDNGSAQGLKVRIKANDSGNFNILDLVSASTGSDVSVMTVTDYGNVLVGKTATGIGTAGIELTHDNVILGTRSGGVAQYLNRLSSDGDILQFMKDGSTVGSIGSNAAAGVPVLDISANSSSGIMRMLTSGSEAMRIDQNGAVTKPYQPAFSVKRTQSTSIAINTDTVISWDTEIFDQNADFNISTHTFTAPVSGKYQLQTILRLNNIDSSASYYIINIVTSNRSYQHIMDPNGMDGSDPDYWSLQVSVLADMDASDTARVEIYQAGGAAQTAYDGNAGANSFSGYLVA